MNNIEQINALVSCYQKTIHSQEKEGFCWTDINSTILKSRLKEKGIFDVVSMTLFTQTNIPDLFCVLMINTKIKIFYVEQFINNTSHFQINDARQLPIVILSNEELKEAEQLFKSAYNLKLTNSIAKSNELNIIEEQIEKFVRNLYKI